MSDTPGSASGVRAAPALATPECVSCGFCLPVCPTYDALGTEMDSPRGRLRLMAALEEGRVSAAEPVVRHLDLCLGCRACEAECPSGVPYGAKLEAARERLRGSSARPRAARLAESLVLRAVAAPPWLQAAGAGLLSVLHRSGLARLAGSPALSSRLPPRLASAAGLLAASVPGRAALPAVTPARGARRLRAGLLLGCVGRLLHGQVNAATARLLARAGCEVAVPAGQVCCGALHAHAGDLRGARRLARANIAAFERAGELDVIVVNAAGCGSVMKEYGRLIGGDGADGARAARVAAKVRDALELLAEIGLPPAPREVRATVAYHDACHLAHAQGVREAPRRLLASVPGLRLLPLSEADRCCGSAGIYNLLHPETAAKILRRKLTHLRESGADVAAAANPGCLMQIAAGARRAGLPLRALHPLEILDAAYSEEPAARS